MNICKTIKKLCFIDLFGMQIADKKAIFYKTNIYFTSSATFVMLEEGDGVPYVPSAPPLLPVLPYDVFYPFTTTRASSANSIYGSSRTALIVSILISFFCLFVNSN